MMRKFIKLLILSSILCAAMLFSSCTEVKAVNSGLANSKIDEEQIKEVVFATGFSGADGITIDSYGNMYVGNRNTNIISKVDKQGRVTDFVTVQCTELLCMTADKEGNIFAAGKDKVLKISSTGDVTELAKGFTCADDLRLDQDRNLYVTDSFENRVYKITPSLEKSIFIDSDEDINTMREEWHITGITFDNSYKNLYIARMKKGEILKYPIKEDGSPGNPVVLLKNLEEPDHLEMDMDGRLYVTLFREGSLIRVDDKGNYEYLCDRGMSYATGIVLGKNGFDKGSAYVADYGSNSVMQISINN